MSETTQATQDAGAGESAPTPADTAAYLDALVGEAVEAALPTATERARDANGRFTKVEDVAGTEDGESSDEQADATDAEGEIPTTATADGPEADEATNPETDATAEGDVETVAPTLPTLARDPIVPLTVKVGDAVVEGVPDMLVTFTGPGGKERAEPLDKLVRLAQDGIYQEGREARFRGIEAEATQAKQTVGELQANLQRMQAYVEDVMADEGRYLAEKDRWDRQHTPEAQAERYRQEMEQMRQQQEVSAIAREGEIYFTEALTPALDTIAQAVPFVSAEELVAKVSLQVDRMKGGKGYLTPDQYRTVSEFVLHDLAPWAQQVNAARAERFAPKQDTTIPKATPKAAIDADKVAADNQKLKRQVAKAIKPVGKAAPDAPRPKRPPANVDEAMEDATEAAVRAVLGG